MNPPSPRAHAMRLMVIAVAAGLLLTMIGVGTAAAHETREVGPYTLVVGWIDEPAYAGLPNAVDLRINETDGDEPVEDLGDELEVDMIYGDETLAQGFEPRFGEPGAYRSDLVPTRPGTWEFRLHGTIEDEEIDETFTSGPETFNDIEDRSSVSFPSADPTTAELAERLERELDRLEEEGAQQDQEMDADAAADSEPAGQQPDILARVVSLVAVALGGVAVLLAMRRRAS